MTSNIKQNIEDLSLLDTIMFNGSIFIFIISSFAYFHHWQGIDLIVEFTLLIYALYGLFYIVIFLCEIFRGNDEILKPKTLRKKARDESE